MTVLMVRAKVKPEHVAEVEAAAEKMFSAIDQAHPTNIRYASTKLADGVTFVALLEVAEGTDNPLPTLQAFRDFQENLRNWVAEPPTPEQLEVVGSYRLFD
jgi:uncharacterized caspase-like protein